MGNADILKPGLFIGILAFQLFSVSVFLTSDL